MSNPTPPADSFLNSPLITTLTGYIVHLQKQKIFSKERLHSFKTHFLITIGFVVLLYCLIHIQILFFWLLKLIFRLLFKFFSFIFWLPLKTVRFFIPKTIDYDILFPVFWLCSISSFYISKYSHENICQLFDQYLVRRYKIFNYDQIKREDFKRYLFVLTFIVLLLLQSLFILIPITLSIRQRHINEKLSSVPVVATTTTTVKTPTTKSAVKDVVNTMGENLYNRFIDAFKDENETQNNEKRSPLVSDEKLEDAFKTFKKSVTKGINQVTSTNDQNEDKKSSRFQRWIVHYLKAPFQKWEKKTNEQINSNIEQKHLENESEEETKEEEIDSSLDTDDDDDDDSSESDNDDLEEQTTITENIKQRLETVKNKVCLIMIIIIEIEKIFIRFLLRRITMTKIPMKKKKKKI
jgi:hypothetical protein